MSALMADNKDSHISSEQATCGVEDRHLCGPEHTKDTASSGSLHCRQSAPAKVADGTEMRYHTATITRMYTGWVQCPNVRN